MSVNSIAWLGTRTDRYEEMATFLHEVLGLVPGERGADWIHLWTRRRDLVELFTPDNPDHDFFGTAPVPGFGVDQLAAACARLEAAGVEFLGRTRETETWQHFRAPDGRVYELKEAARDRSVEAAEPRAGGVTARALVWLGIWTDEFQAMLDFLRDVLALAVVEQAPRFARFQLPNRDQVELFGLDITGSEHAEAPLAEFLVDDAGAAQRELERAGIEIVRPLRRWNSDYHSAHFRAPDGNLYGILSGRYYVQR
jgi:catechol 2,3-dioxygenase-like lactoylglutathione lyase family enzyme